MPSPRRSLAFRLLLANLTLTLAALWGLVLWTGYRLQSVRLVEARVELGQKAILIANGLREPIALREREEDEAKREDDDEEAPSLPEFQERDLDTLVNSYAREVSARVAVFSSDLHLLASSAAGESSDDEAAPELAAALHGGEAYSTRADERNGAERLFVAALIAGSERPRAVVQLSVPMTDLRAGVRATWLRLITAGLVVTLLSILASVFVARQIIRPIQALTAAANQLAAGDLGTRLDLDRQDELGQLAAAFDHMASEIGKLLGRERAFVANASHELRSPLTAIQLRAELLQRLLPPDERSQRYLAEIEGETGYLSRLTAQLLDLERIDAGAAPLQSCSPLPVLAQVIKSMQLVAEEKQIQLAQELPSSLGDVLVSAEQLELVLRNVLDNAIKYTPAGGRVRLSAAQEKQAVKVVVEDTGIGISAAELPHVFDRFYRADKARDRRGVGLGLSLVQAIMTHCQGKVTIASHEGQGTTVTLLFPA